jgi:hypothetical protein
MHAALDHVTVEHAVCKARSRVSAFVVGNVGCAIDVLNRQCAGPDRKGPHRTRRHVGAGANANHIHPIVGHREYLDYA